MVSPNEVRRPSQVYDQLLASSLYFKRLIQWGVIDKSQALGLVKLSVDNRLNYNGGIVLDESGRQYVFETISQTLPQDPKHPSSWTDRQNNLIQIRVYKDNGEIQIEKLSKDKSRPKVPQKIIRFVKFGLQYSGLYNQFDDRLMALYDVGVRE